MSMMMPEDQYDAEGRPLQGTLFNYNDNILNNIGTFATNELLGVDDFQRAFGNFDRGDISFWDRLKAGATGVGEFGSTAALFVPGANIVAGASKIPTLGKVASKAAPFVLPTTTGEKLATVGATGAATASGEMPEDSPLGMLLGLGALGAGIPAVAAGVRSFRNRRTGTAGAVGTTQPFLPGLENFGGTTAAPGSTSAARGATRLIPKTGKGRFGLIAGALAGLGALGAAGLARRDDTPSTPYVPTTLPGSVGIPTAQDRYQTAMDILQQGTREQRQLIQQDRNRALQGFGQAERAALDEYLNTLDIAAQGQSAAARREYQNLYDRLAGDVASIEGMGAEGAANVRRRYRQAARRAAREGGREQVRSGVGGMTPVSGAVSDIATGLRGQGGDLAQYLRNNAATAARDAGFDAETSLEYGNAVANQFEQQMAMMGAGQRYQTETALAQQERDLRAQYDAMLSDLARQGIDAETQLSLQQALEGEQALSAGDLLASPAGAALTADWDQFSKILSGDLTDATEVDVQIARNVADQLNALYGDVSLEAYARFYADRPELLSTLLGG